MSVLEIDNSTMRAMAECSTEALVRYVLGYTTAEERATLRSGTALHEALAAYFRSSGDKEQALRVFEKSYREFADANVAPDDRLAWHNLNVIVSYWLESHPLGQLPFKVPPELVEIGFSYPLTEPDQCACGHYQVEHLNDEDDTSCFADRCPCHEFCSIVFCGRLDGIASFDGSVYILEHKSTGAITAKWLKKWFLDSQLSGYMWAAQQHFDSPIVGVILNAIEFGKVPTSDRKCPKHGTPYHECGYLHTESKIITVPRAPEQINEWRKTAIHLAKRYRDLRDKFGSIDAIQRVRMQGAFHNACPDCALIDWCIAGRNAAELKSNFIQEFWHPFKRATETRDHTGHKP